MREDMVRRFAQETAEAAAQDIDFLGIYEQFDEEYNLTEEEANAIYDLALTAKVVIP